VIDDGIGTDLVAFVVDVGIVADAAVFVSAADGKSFMQTAPETK
jgi:hypothetical protein